MDKVKLETANKIQSKVDSIDEVLKERNKISFRRFAITYRWDTMSNSDSYKDLPCDELLESRIWEVIQQRRKELLEEFKGL